MEGKLEVAASTGLSEEAPRFEDQTIGTHLYPLWEQVSLHQTGHPVAEPPCHWQWSDVHKLFDGAVRATSTSHAERRVLLMANPAYANGPQRTRTTKTLQGAYQILMPGESARPHRHTPNALRFMLEDGGETYTVVDGKECLMSRGDIVLTPGNTWHSHRHAGASRSVWFDALDAALPDYLDVSFFEPGSKLVEYPRTVADDAYVVPGLSPVPPPEVVSDYSPRFRFPWSDTLSALAAAPVLDDGSCKLRLVNPAGGALAMPPMDAYILRLTRCPTRGQRTTASAICVAASGSGITRLGERDLRWVENDVFVLPHWEWASHRAISDDAVLFVVTDRGHLERLGYLRDEFA
jgi:gentisate 1,2-dioxygenase